MTPHTNPPMWTSRYQAQDEIIASGLTPVGITQGRPRFPLRYKPAEFVRVLAPTHAEIKIADDDEFRRAYFKRLEEWGPDRVARLLFNIYHEAGDGSGLVLLCFEDVWAGESCHRRDFAEWWEQQTGQVVHELPSRSKKASPQMQMQLDEAVKETLGIT
jgi:hypothetical protein